MGRVGGKGTEPQALKNFVFFAKIINFRPILIKINAFKMCWRTVEISSAKHDSNACIRDGTGQDFLDPTGKFQNYRPLIGRSTGFLQKVFVHCSMFLMKIFSKGEGHG